MALENSLFTHIKDPEGWRREVLAKVQDSYLNHALAEVSAAQYHTST
jgi:hypothetical protein